MHSRAQVMLDADATDAGTISSRTAPPAQAKRAASLGKSPEFGATSMTCPVSASPEAMKLSTRIRSVAKPDVGGRLASDGTVGNPPVTPFTGFEVGGFTFEVQQLSEKGLSR